MSYTTSATYTALRVIEARLQAITFPSPPASTISDEVACWFGDPNQPQPDENQNPPNATERAVLIPDVQSTSEWGPSGNYARVEKFTLTVYVETAIQGRTSLQALARCEELTAAIEADIRTQFHASRRAATYPAALVPFNVWSIAVVGVEPVTPISATGYASAANVRIGCEFRINQTALT